MSRASTTHRRSGDDVVLTCTAVGVGVMTGVALDWRAATVLAFSMLAWQLLADAARSGDDIPVGDRTTASSQLYGGLFVACCLPGVGFAALHALGGSSAGVALGLVNLTLFTWCCAGTEAAPVPARLAHALSLLALAGSPLPPSLLGGQPAPLAHYELAALAVAPQAWFVLRRRREALLRTALALGFTWFALARAFPPLIL